MKLHSFEKFFLDLSRGDTTALKQYLKDGGQAYPELLKVVALWADVEILGLMLDAHPIFWRDKNFILKLFELGLGCRPASKVIDLIDFFSSRCSFNEEEIIKLYVFAAKRNDEEVITHLHARFRFDVCKSFGDKKSVVALCILGGASFEALGWFEKQGALIEAEEYFVEISLAAKNFEALRFFDQEKYCFEYEKELKKRGVGLFLKKFRILILASDPLASKKFLEVKLAGMLNIQEKVFCVGFSGEQPPPQNSICFDSISDFPIGSFRDFDVVLVHVVGGVFVVKKNRQGQLFKFSF